MQLPAEGALEWGGGELFLGLVNSVALEWREPSQRCGPGMGGQGSWGLVMTAELNLEGRSSVWRQRSRIEPASWKV